MQLEPGTRLGPYEIQSHIGAGGMGEVYRARDHRLERDVAIKVLPSQFAPGSRQLKQFELEARMLASLNHPSICAIYDIGAENGVAFIVMEHLRGETLAARITRGPISVHVAIRHALQIAEALGAAHGANVIHRDIKPGNIMLTTLGIKLLDFGLAKRHMAAALATSMSGATTGLPDTGVQGIVGTLHYMAPEQLSGGVVDARSDIWAFGCVIYEMVAGRRAFSGTLTEVIAAIVADRPPAWTVEHGVAPLALEHLVSRCLSRDPAERWQTVGDLSKELLAILPHAKEERPPAVTAPPASKGPATKSPSSAAKTPAPGSSKSSAAASVKLSSQKVSGDGVAQTEAADESAAPRRVNASVWIAAAAAAVVVLGALGWQFRARLFPQHASVVAVLPFVNGGTSADQEFWGEGLAEGISVDLARYEGIRAVPASVAFRYKASAAQTAGQALGADRIVTGRVEVQAGRLVVDAAVMAQPGGAQLWRGHFSEPVAQAPALQREVTADILKALGHGKSGGEASTSALPSQVNGDAYSLMLQGWYSAQRHDERSLRSAISLFNQATTKDARLASAFAGTASAYARLAHFPLDAIRPSDALPNAKSAAIKALELDPSLVDAHVALGFTKSIYEGDWQGAGAEYDRAVALRPDDPEPRVWRSEWLMAMGRTEEAIEEARTATRLDPMSTDATLNLGWQLTLAKRYDEAIEQLKTIAKTDSDAGAVDWATGIAYGEAGQHDEALKALKAASDASASQPVYLASLAYAQARLRHTAEAKQILDRLKDMSAHQYVSSYELALTALALDDSGRAFDLLQHVVDDHAPSVALLPVDPRLDALRPDARFKELLKRAGL